MSDKRALIVCWDCNKHLGCPRVADKPLECADYDQQAKRPGPERPPDRHWYKVASIEVGKQVSDDTPLSAQERAAIAERAARIAEMSTEDDCEYVESVLQLADSDIPRLQAHIEALEKRIEVLEKPLGFYASKSNWYKQNPSRDPYATVRYPSKAEQDSGERAREVLK